jgi:2'-5' RNA ligase
MTQYAIVAFPRTGALDAIEAIRARFDPLAGVIAAHVTLVFPFEAAMPIDELRSHVKSVASRTPAFRANITAAPRLDGEYLFLDISNGAGAFAELHDRLYDGMLNAHRSMTHLYTPHITIARSATAARLHDAAADGKTELPSAIDMVIDHVALFQLDDATHGSVQDRFPLSRAPSASHDF